MWPYWNEKYDLLTNVLMHELMNKKPTSKTSSANQFGCKRGGKYRRNLHLRGVEIYLKPYVGFMLVL